jgi:hypothetical protein
MRLEHAGRLSPARTEILHIGGATIIFRAADRGLRSKSESTAAPERSSTFKARIAMFDENTIDETILTGDVRAEVSFARDNGTNTPELEVDLHGYHPDQICGEARTVDEECGGALINIIRQAWEMGAERIRFIHGHGRNRGITPGFVNTNTGYFGLRLRSELRHDGKLRQWIKYSTLDCSHEGSTVVKLKWNPRPTRADFGDDIFPERRHRF